MGVRLRRILVEALNVILGFSLTFWNLFTYTGSNISKECFCKAEDIFIDLMAIMMLGFWFFSPTFGHCFLKCSSCCCELDADKFTSNWLGFTAGKTGLIVMWACQWTYMGAGPWTTATSLPEKVLEIAGMVVALAEL